MSMREGDMQWGSMQAQLEDGQVVKVRMHAGHARGQARVHVLGAGSCYAGAYARCLASSPCTCSSASGRGRGPRTMQCLRQGGSSVIIATLHVTPGQMYRSHVGPVDGLAASWDGSLCVSISRDKTVKVWLRRGFEGVGSGLG